MFKFVPTKSPRLKRQTGFTIIEMVVVIVLLGVISVGLSSFIKTATQSYVNTSERDALISSARFVVERLNREIRNALPNSVRVKSDGSIECLEFLPIVGSTVYLDVPVSPEPAANSINVIPFIDTDDNDYQCSGNCLDHASIYPISSTDIYVDSSQTSGQMFAIDEVEYTNANQWKLKLQNAVTITTESPTQRLYVVSGPVSYCEFDGSLFRSSGYSLSNASYLFPPAIPVLMSNELNKDKSSTFKVLEASLQRTSVIQLSLSFSRADEEIVFNHEIHLPNAP